MIVLSCNSLTKSYVVDKVLDDVSFSLNDNEKVGLVGINGAGKSTLFKILSNRLSKDSGDIYTAKDCKIGYLEQEAQIQGDNTVLEEVISVFQYLIDMEAQLRSLEHEIAIEGQNEGSQKLQVLMDKYSHLLEDFTEENGYGFRSEVRGVLKGLGFIDDQFDQPVFQLSGGQKARISLAKLLLRRPDVLLLDEPTNHLDMDAIVWLEKYIRDYKGAAIIISHDRYFLDATVSKVFLLENSNLKIYNGNYTTFMKKRKVEREQLEKKYEEQQKEVKRQEDIIKSLSLGGKRAIRQAQSRQKMLDKMKLIDRPESDRKKARFRFEPKVKSGNDVLQIESLRKNFDEFKLFDNVSFNIYKGERVGLIGPNGIGKSTLLKIIMKVINPSDGSVNLGHHVNIGYYDQEQSNLNLEKTIVDEIWDENPNFDHYQIRTLLAQFLFQGDDIFKEIGDLSGGEKSRIALLKLMLSKANFLLIDEPTNHLDIDSREVLEDALLNYDGTILVISHDRYFLNKVTDKILELSHEGINEYLGNYSYYLEKKNALLDLEDDDGSGKTKTQIKMERKKEKEKMQTEKKQREMIKKLESEISIKENRIIELETLMCDPEVFSDIEKSQKLHDEANKIKDELEKLYDEWVYMTED